MYIIQCIYIYIYKIYNYSYRKLFDLLLTGYASFTINKYAASIHFNYLEKKVFKINLKNLKVYIRKIIYSQIDIFVFKLL